MRSVSRKRDRRPYGNAPAGYAESNFPAVQGHGIAQSADRSGRKRRRQSSAGTAQNVLWGAWITVPYVWKEYIVKSGRQRYCPDCAAEAVREVDREASKQWNKENGFYEKRRLSPRNGVKICVICGKPVPAGTPSITCSEECDRLRLRLSGQNVRIRNGKRKTEPTISRLDRPAKEKEKE